MDPVILAFLVTLAAGLCTGIGSAIAFFTRHTNRAFLSLALGFSAGVMIYVSFVEILPKARESLLSAGDSQLRAVTTSTIGFFAGMILIAVIDRLIGRFSNPHEGISVELMDTSGGSGEIRRRAGLRRMGVLVALAVALHNFPEGLGTFLVLLEDPAVGIVLAAAIAIHNIPEGIAISVPIYHATGKRSKAFLYSFSSGLAEPLGAVTGYLILRPFIDETTFGIVFAGVAGIMIFISLDQLLPAAREYGRPHLAIYGLIAGMMVMAGSLVLFAA
jgi:ZIP family zinc transporter